MAQGTFSEFLGRVLGWSSVFRPAYTPPRSVPGCGLGNRATQLWHRNVGCSCHFLFRPADPPALGVGGDLGIFSYSDCGTGLCDFLFSLFRLYNFASPLSLRLWRYFGCLLFRGYILDPPPLSGIMAGVLFHVFLVPYG